MSILWFAFGIYILGVALVLFLRPSLMFHEGAGLWKEFGLGASSQRTLFPFWLFTIVWAVVSYVVATLFSVYVATLSLRSEAGSNNFLTPISAVTASLPSLPSQPSPSPDISSLSSKVPGYYILESSPTEAARYVYFGQEPPTLSNVARASPRAP
jgi:hypothetical protein